MTQTNHFQAVLAISLGAIVGANARYGLTTFIQAQFGKDLIYFGTFCANSIGCFIIALFITLSQHRLRHLPPGLSLFIVTGFCGAFTTFSAYGLETIQLSQTAGLIIAAMYWLGSPLVGMVAVLLGVAVGRLWL